MTEQRTNLSSKRFVESCCQGLALFLGGFTTVSLLIKWRVQNEQLDPNRWWVCLNRLPEWLADGLLAVLALGLLCWSLWPKLGERFRAGLLGLLGFFALATFCNALAFWWLAWRGSIGVGQPLPISLLFCGGLLCVMHAVAQRCSAVDRRAQLGAALVCMALFPVLQTVGFGKTDYRRTAEVAVVFGARTYANGQMSTALADRVNTACDLYRRGLVGRLIFSGGPGDGAVHECEAMQAAAIKAGVPLADIELDRAGLSTSFTVHNTVAELRGKRVIVVSEYYHLPRIKFAYQTVGLNVFTVPAAPSSFARSVAASNVIREVPAFWCYYLGAATGQL